MSDALSRRMRILELLPHHKDGKITVSRIIDLLSEDGIYAETRAVQRDMDELSRNYPIACDDSNKPFQWYWSANDALTIPAMGQFTALTFHLAELILKPLLPSQSFSYLKPKFSIARRALDDADKRRTRRWLKKVRVVPHTMHQISAPIKNGVFDNVTQALYDDLQLELTYLAASSETGASKKYSIHPFGLIHRDTTTELVGVIDSKDTIIRWPLHRIVSAKILPNKSVIPSHFDFDQYIRSALAHPLSGDLITFKAWIKKHSQAFNHVLETRLSSNQKIQYVDDGLIITAKIYETIELKWWILGLGERIKVLKPPSLQDEIKRTATETAELYK